MSTRKRTLRVPLLLEPQPEGGYTVTSPAIRGLVTEGDTIEEAMNHAREAFAVVLEFYEDDKRPLPKELLVEESDTPIETEILVPIAIDEFIPA